MVRVFVLDHKNTFDSDNALHDHLRKLNLNEIEIEDFFKLALDFASWREGGLTHLHKCIASMHHHSRFTLEHLEGAFECAQSTLAGTALADLLFCFLKFGL